MEREKAGGGAPRFSALWAGKKVALSWGCGCFISTVCWEYGLFLQLSIFSSPFAGGLRGGGLFLSIPYTITEPLKFLKHTVKMYFLIKLHKKGV